MLDNWSGMDKEKTKDYILRCQVCEASASTRDGIRELSEDCTIFWTYMFVENVCVYIKEIDIFFFLFYFSSLIMVALD